MVGLWYRTVTSRESVGDHSTSICVLLWISLVHELQLRVMEMHHFLRGNEMMLIGTSSQSCPFERITVLEEGGPYTCFCTAPLCDRLEWKTRNYSSIFVYHVYTGYLQDILEGHLRKHLSVELGTELLFFLNKYRYRGLPWRTYATC